MTQTGPPAQALSAKALPLAPIDTPAMPARTAKTERLVRRLRILAPPGLACTGTPREMLAQLSGGDSALQRRRRPRRRAVPRIGAARFVEGTRKGASAWFMHAEVDVRLTRPHHSAGRSRGRHVHLHAPLCSNVALPTSDKHWLP